MGLFAAFSRIPLCDGFTETAASLLLRLTALQIPVNPTAKAIEAR
jgi:hypothetical protein